LPPYQGDFTPDTLLSVAKAAKAKGLATTEYLCPIGYNALAGFQTYLFNNQIKYAGTTNTVGGVEVKGMNAMVFKALDIDFLLTS